MSGPHWRTVIKRMDPDYLYAEDIGPRGTTLDVEITSTGVGRIKNPGGSKETIWLGFAGHRKKLGINATIAKTLENISGSDHWGDWRGWVTLVVVHKDNMRDPTADGGTSPMDVIRIAPHRPHRVAVGGPAESPTEEPPLVARLDACATRKDYVALDAEMRSDWERIPKGAARAAVSAAYDRATARLKSAPQPDTKEQP